MELLSTLLVALVGGAGVLGIVQSVQALSARRRLHAAIQANTELLDHIDDERTRSVMRQAITTDPLKLAALSLDRSAPAAGGWTVPALYSTGFIAALLVTALAVTGWDPQTFVELMPLIVPTLVIVIFIPYAVLLTISSRRRRQYNYAVTTLARTDPPINTTDVRAGMRALSRIRQQRIWRQERRHNATPAQWASLRRYAIRRQRRRRSFWHTTPWV